MQCVREFWAVRGLDTTAVDNFAIGADDLVPIFCYVLTKTGAPCLWTQSAYIAEFIDESLVHGEEGYACATLDTALQVLRRLRRPGR